MNLDHFRYFVEAAKAQHLGVAAKRLHVTPGAVGQAIRLLESQYGCRLFQKSGRRVQLTADGQRLCELGEELLNHAERVNTSMRGLPATWKGTYRVCATHQLLSLFVVPRLAEIQRSYPEMVFEVLSMCSAEVIEAIAHGEADLGFCFNALPHPAVVTKRFLEEELLIAVRPGHEFTKRLPARLTERLSALPSCCPKALRGIEICENHPELKKLGIRQNINFIFDSYEAAVAKILSSDSWGLIPRSIAEKKGLHTIKIRGWNAKAEIMIAWPNARPPALPLQKFMS